MTHSEPLHLPKSKKWWQFSLTTWILLSMVIGLIIGLIAYSMKDATGGVAFTENFKFLRTIFINLIKSIIAPLVFSTIVVGIAGGHGMNQVGRMAWKSILYFTAATTCALFIGLAVVNVTQPGLGVALHSNEADALGAVKSNHPKTFAETMIHIFTSSIFKSMAEGDVLQIVAFSVLFAMAVLAVGERGKPVVKLAESLAQVMFQFTEFVMRFAPIGVGAAMAITIGHQGPGVLWNLSKLIGSLYLALTIFIVFVLTPIMYFLKIPIRQFWKAVREPATIAFATTSSESALPKAMQAMERFGVPKHIVGFVMPTGYSFNLDGSTLYLAMASMFVAQAAGVPFTFGHQLEMMLMLMITSKGIAAVPRASLVVLLATLSQFSLPEIGVAVIFAVDELMDMGRTAVNLIGNSLATAVIARWEGEFDHDAALAYDPNDHQS